RTWIKDCGYISPNQKKLTTIQQTLLHAAQDRRPSVAWKNVVMKRYRDDLFLLAIHSETEDSINTRTFYEWDFKKSLNLPGIGKLHAIATKGEGLAFDIKHISVRFRQGGEIANLSKQSSRTLKNLFQEWKVLPWERNRIPLLFVEDKL